MATIDKKQKRWYSKSTFDSLDKTTIPVGTEIQVTGEIEETDLTADLQTKINGKLTAPTTPTADSVVTMLADGTVGTKSLSEIGGGGGKLYMHNINLTCAYEGFNYSLYFKIYSSISESFTINDLPSHTPSNTYVYVEEYEGLDIERDFVGNVKISTVAVEVQCSIVSNGLTPVTSFMSRVLLIEINTVTVNDTVIEI